MDGWTNTLRGAWLGVMLGVALAAGPSPAGAAEPRRLALLVAIDRYDHVTPTDGKPPWPRLNSTADAKALAATLTSPRYGFAPGNVALLTDGAATRDGIVRAFQAVLLDQARPGDIVVFYFAGHGQNVPTGDGGVDQSLVPWDYVSQDARVGARTNLRRETLRQLLRQLVGKLHANGRRGSLTAIFDCCCSTSRLRGHGAEVVARGRGWQKEIDGIEPPALTALAAQRLTEGLIEHDQQVGYVALSACQAEQSALEFRPQAGVFRGAFTWFLIQELQRATPASTYASVFQRIWSHFSAVGLAEKQQPSLQGDTNQPLFGTGARAVPAFAVTRPGQAAGELVLPAGELHGVTVGSVYALYRAGAGLQAAARLATAKVVRRALTESVLQLAASDARRLSAADLAGAEAVETAHNHSAEPLPVYLAPTATAWRARLADLRAIDLQVSEGAAAVRLDVAQGRLALQTRTKREADQEFGNLTSWPDAPASATALRAALLCLARWHAVARLGCDQPRRDGDIELRLLHCDAETLQSTNPNWRPAPMVGGVWPVYRERDGLWAEVRNPSDQPVYVSLLELGCDGAIKVLWPTEDGPSFRLPAHSDWTRMPAGRLVSAETGISQLKALASREPLPHLDSLAQGGLGGEAGSKGTPTAPATTEVTGWSAADVYYWVK